MAQSIGQFVNELTRGRGFVFVIMSFEHNLAEMLFERFQSIVEGEFGLACLRADHVKSAGHDLLHKIHELIQRADLVVADISERETKDFSPNVFYEVGYTIAKEKPILLLSHFRTKIPTDLLGLETIRYGDTSWKVFEGVFREHLQTRLGSRAALLRDMLLPNDPTPSLIVASPKYPSVNSRIQGQRYDQRTFGDNLGIVGLLSTFGSVLGEAVGLELVSADYHDPKLETESFNLYLIGSKKVNKLAGVMLDLLQRGRVGPYWYLGAETPEEERPEEDYRVRLYRTVGGVREAKEGDKAPLGENGSEVHTRDYGIVVRAAPNLRQPDGHDYGRAHSLGTGAACIAATRSQKIEQIRTKLGEDRDALADKSKAIWALVEGTAGPDGMLADDQVQIEEAGVYRDPEPKK